MLTECAYCMKPLEPEEVGTIWCDTPLGMTTLKTCKTQECGKGALAARPGWKMRKDNQPPMSKKEKLGGGAGGAARHREGGSHRHQIPRD